MMHAVVTGIGFIGGGMIYTQKRSHGSYGLTSAATVVLVAGIGMAAGAGAPLIAAAVTLMALITLSGVSAIEARFTRRQGSPDSAGDEFLDNHSLDADE